MRIRKKAVLPHLFAADKSPLRLRKQSLLRTGRLRWVMLSVLLLGVFITILPYLLPASYSLGKAENVVAHPASAHADLLKEDTKKHEFVFNAGYVPNTPGSMISPSPQITAVAHTDAKKGVTVTDPTHKIEFTVTPEMGLRNGKKDENRVIYPFRAGGGWLVYTMQSSGVKEDLVLKSSPGDTASWDYRLKLEDGYEPRLESDGSIGVYGNTALLGDITPATDSDKTLLEKARKNGAKETLLFSIPAPYVVETGKSHSDVKTSFSLNGDRLTVTATGLNKASYPLSIDPSIYVETAEKFMRGNNDSNVDFDVANTLIQKGGTTGARFDNLTTTTAMPAARWNHGSTVAGGYTYVVGGNDGTSNQSSVYWAKLNSNTYTIDSPNPGSGACSGWCTDSAYNLPAPREALSLVAYNGYLYAIGGEDSSCTTANGTGDGGICSTVYIAKLGANGEPSLWHPTDSNQSNWVYWYRAADLSSPRSYSGAVAYQNSIYLAGGTSYLEPGGVDTVERAKISPTGDLASWSSAGMEPLPAESGKHHHSLEVYNDRLYIIGGVNGTLSTGNIINTVFYARIVNGDINGWTQTSSLSGPRMTWGGSYSAVIGGYLYQAGGCSAVNASGFCTTIESSTQFASINMAGNITPWRTMSGVSNQFIGYGLEAWNGAIYRLGGCTAQDPTTGNCTTAASSTGYAPINGPGDITQIATSSASGAGTCTGSSPYDCDLPTAGDSAAQGGRLLSSAVVMRGYLYVIGGCVNVGCTDLSGNVLYTRVTPEGNLARPATCIGSYSGAWCVDNTNRVNGTTGVAAAGVATYGNTIYIVGGTNGTSNINTIYRNKVNNDGSLAGAWTSQSLSGVGGTSVAHTFAYARANPAEAATNPANLYLFGGCTTTSAASCTGSSYSSAVQKCNIQTTGAVAGCTTSGQLQIDSEPVTVGSQGLALHSGAVFADYIYLVGGTSQSTANRSAIIYAKFDDSNNVAAVSGGTWTTATESLSTGRNASVSFGLNGYLYVLGGYNSGSSTVHSTIERAKINAIDGSLEPFSVSGTTLGSRWGMSVGVSSSKFYAIGGCSSGAGTGSCSAFDATFRTVQIHNNESGAPEAYTAATNLFNTDRIAASATVYNGNLYIAGGCIDSASCGTVTNNVQYAPLDSSGNVGTWVMTTANLPAALAWGQLEVAGNTLYYIGGQSGAGVPTANVYYATPTGTGDVTSWSTATNVLPQARTQHSAAVWDNRIFVAGGNNSSGVAQSTVYVSPQLNSGGNITSAWSSANAFDVARSGLSAITYANNLYILGGYTGSAFLSDVQVAKINSDGTLGSWAFSSNLPMPIEQADGFAANGYMYLFGGRSGPSVNDCQDRTYVAPISANTSIASGNNPTGLGSWYEASATYGGERFGIATAYYDGKAYLLGGGCAELLNKTQLYDTPGSYTFTPPEGVNNLIVEAWAGGGGGGSGEPSGAGNAAGAGGGGGGYARGTLPAASYSLSVGAGGSAGVNGGDSWFDSTSTIFAQGGAGASWGPTFGAGGTANIGSDNTFNGGSGGTGFTTAGPNNRRGGGGGGSAYFNANGNDGGNGGSSAGTGLGGTGTATGGNGANSTSNGGAGGFPGAGGGGGGYRGSGGTGGNGRIIVYFDEWSELVLTGSNRVTVATLDSQPQIARYSIMFDTDTDVFPKYWLLNGVDNSIGAKWSLDYQSMPNTTTSCTSPAMTTWGQNTAFGNVTLGTPGVYTPKDASGADTSCARYYYFMLNVDSSQAYGYPDDVTRGPTITDLTLQFTADPSKRLMHGRTFTGGLQQPLDAPYDLP